MPLAVVLLLFGCGGAAEQPPEPTTLVTTAQPRQGDAVRWVTAYGTATPASNGVDTLSIQQPGQVAEVLTTAGSVVRAGQPILRFAVAPSAQAAYESASTTLATTRQQRETTARLLDQQLATRDQLAQADKAVADASAALAAARREGAGQAVQLIRAPYDGVIATVPVAQGDRTQPGAALATVARRGGIIVTVGLDPGERAGIAVGRPARLQPLDGGPAVGGHVIRVDGQLNPTSHLLDLDLGFPAGAILPGQATRAEVAAGTARGWIVPHAAVVTDDQGAHVFQISGGKARAVPVTIVQAGRSDDVVIGKIASGQPLILSGAYQVEDGAPVRQGR